MGHATRSAAIANVLIEHQHDVVFAASGKAYDFLKQEYPRHELIYFPSFKISYSKSSFTTLKIFLKLPVILYHIFKEHKKARELTHQKTIDVLVSDNRLGLWGKNYYSVYITHQTRISLPGAFKPFESLLAFLMKSMFINRFDECWIPDMKDGLSGKLSNSMIINPPCRHLGWVSRFTHLNPVKDIKPGRALAIISGPEPCRTYFEKKVIQALESVNMEAILLRGLPSDNSTIDVAGNIRVYNHLDSGRLKYLIQEAEFIIARSGYSTIMDLMHEHTPAILVPTPGQTEQLYLARHLAGKALPFVFAEENKLDLKIQLKELNRKKASSTATISACNPEKAIIEFENEYWGS